MLDFNLPVNALQARKSRGNQELNAPDLANLFLPQIKTIRNRPLKQKYGSVNCKN
jgi:hypothetical protein